jgi:lysophospholipase L1-like esterase
MKVNMHQHRHHIVVSAVSALLFAGLASAQQPPSAQRPPAAPQRGGGSQVPAAMQAKETKTTYKFSFADQPGYTAVAADTIYTPERGYGFEPGSKVTIKDGAATSDEPFFFSAAVPDGNYKVTITFGGAEPSITTVKAELRRLMLEKVETAQGKTETRTIAVNVKTPQYPGGAVRLKGAREAIQEAFNWDPRLNLYFSNKHPSVKSIEIEKADIPTVFILGDSTSTDQMAEPYSSWGQSITAFFKPDVAVANHGESGESMAGAVGVKRPDKIYSQMKKGDYLFVQFGHNDMKSNAENALATFKSGLTKAVEEARKHDATPVLVTPVSRRTFDKDGKITNSFVTSKGDDYLAAVKEVAEQTKAALIDLNAMSATLYESFGTEKAPLLFAHPEGRPVDGTHHDDFGSYEIAKCILEGIRQNKLPLAASIRDDFKGFDPANPDKLEAWDLPLDPPRETERPPGS